MTLRTCSLIFILTIFTTKIFSQELTMFPGLFGYEFFQDDKKIDRKYAKKLMGDVDASRLLWKKANVNQGVSAGLIVVQIGFGAWMIRNEEENKSIAAPAVGFAASAVSAIVFSVRSLTNRRNAILAYNRTFDKMGFKLQIEPATEGLGIVLRF